MSLELKKLRAQSAQVVASRMEMEVKLEELQLAIVRVQKEIDNQLKRENELTASISEKEKNKNG